MDTTVPDDAVATQDTVTQLVTAVRKVRKLVPPGARQVEVSAHDYDTGGKPDCAWDDEVARNALVTGLVADALAIIDALPVVGSDDEGERAVALLALVAGQDVEPGEAPGTWRIARAVAEDRIVSTVDPESRHAHKSRSRYRDGFKGHFAVEPETGLITANTLTGANTPDGQAATELLAEEVRCDVGVAKEIELPNGPVYRYSTLTKRHGLIDSIAAWFSCRTIAHRTSASPTTRVERPARDGYSVYTASTQSAHCRSPP